MDDQTVIALLEDIRNDIKAIKNHLDEMSKPVYYVEGSATNVEERLPYTTARNTVGEEVPCTCGFCGKCLSVLDSPEDNITPENINTYRKMYGK